MAKQPALTAQLLGFPTGRPQDKNVFAFIWGGGDLRTQEEGSKEVRGGSKVTGNKRSITEQFPAGNNWRSILPGSRGTRKTLEKARRRLFSENSWHPRCPAVF